MFDSKKTDGKDIKSVDQSKENLGKSTSNLNETKTWDGYSKINDVPNMKEEPKLSKETIINDKTGFLFDAGNSISLSKKIVEVLQLDETTLKSLGNEGRKNVIKKFNIEKMCISTYSEYKKLIK